ncbi:MAG TPA: MFS transporter [Candidatus Hydrogenedentes bacterium]|mgnify:CR=1 FL=1|nr:MFS transporter [Candidatus Hydrogenedentota bacterium]
MNMTIRIRLSIMMFIEFFVWGAWCVTLGSYLGKGLGFGGVEITNAYSTTAWAAIITPLSVGMVADRFLPAQAVLGVMHLIGAGLMYWLSTITDAGMFFWVLLAYALCYMPTLALVNAIAFKQMTDIEKEFPSIRVLGTLGWIVAGLVISYLLGPAFKSQLGDNPIDATKYPILMAAIASLAMGVYSFTLPHTPPPARGQKFSVSDALGLKALGLMKDLSFAVFLIGSLLICIPLAFYYAFTNMFLVDVGVQNVAAKMSMGQMSEVVFMLVMPFFFKRLGVKKMLLVRMAAWVVRYAFFAYGGPDMPLVLMLYGGILLHGICYDFFFVTGQIYVDKAAPPEIRANAQGLIAMVTYGAGMVIGNFVAGRVVDKYTLESGAYVWKTIWTIPGVMGLVVVILFALMFREKAAQKEIPLDTTPDA